MTTKERLHQLVDQLSEADMHTAERLLEALRATSSTEPSLEDKSWLQADLSDYDSLEPYDWGENGPPHGRPVRYIPNVGLVVDDQS